MKIYGCTLNAFQAISNYRSYHNIEILLQFDTILCEKLHVACNFRDMTFAFWYISLALWKYILQVIGFCYHAGRLSVFTNYIFYQCKLCAKKIVDVAGPHAPCWKPVTTPPPGEVVHRLHGFFS